MFSFFVDFPRENNSMSRSGPGIVFILPLLSKIMTKQFEAHDPYFAKAKALGYRARSAFKLLEIQEKYHILKP
jgi:hypothetical protein